MGRGSARSRSPSPGPARTPARVGAGAGTGLRRFPRNFWVLVAGDGVAHLGYGVFVPYVALYLTGPVGASTTVAGIVLAG